MWQFSIIQNLIFALKCNNIVCIYISVKNTNTVLKEMIGCYDPMGKPIIPTINYQTLKCVPATNYACFRMFLPVAIHSKNRKSPK